MKKFNRIVLALTLLVGVSAMLNAENKRYEVQSGIIVYTMSGGGAMMGIETKSTGSAKMVFTDWGATEFHSDESETVVMGQKEKIKEMSKIDNDKVFVVDFDKKIIYQFSAAMLAASEHKDMMQTGKEMMVSMDGKKIGEEKIAGYPCEIWEMAPIKLWLHKGIMLKSEVEMMGMTSRTVATKVDLDASVSQDDLKLPDFPIQETSPEAFNKEESDDAPQLTPEQLEQMQEMMKGFTQK